MSETAAAAEKRNLDMNARRSGETDSWREERRKWEKVNLMKLYGIWNETDRAEDDFKKLL